MDDLEIRQRIRPMIKAWRWFLFAGGSLVLVCFAEIAAIVVSLTWALAPDSQYSMHALFVGSSAIGAIASGYGGWQFFRASRILVAMADGRATELAALSRSIVRAVISIGFMFLTNFFTGFVGYLLPYLEGR
jgi:hypothetical protein